jgi:hypothetical protein
MWILVDPLDRGHEYDRDVLIIIHTSLHSSLEIAMKILSIGN